MSRTSRCPRPTSAGRVSGAGRAHGAGHGSASRPHVVRADRRPSTTERHRPGGPASRRPAPSVCRTDQRSVAAPARGCRRWCCTPATPEPEGAESRSERDWTPGQREAFWVAGHVSQGPALLRALLCPDICSWRRHNEQEAAKCASTTLDGSNPATYVQLVVAMHGGRKLNVRWNGCFFPKRPPHMPPLKGTGHSDKPTIWLVRAPPPK